MKLGNRVYEFLFLFAALSIIVVIAFRAGNICMPHLFLDKLAVYMAVQKDSAVCFSDLMGRFYWDFKFVT